MYQQKRCEPDLALLRKDYSDAVGYHRRAEEFLKQGERLSLVFNVASCALERYLVAVCDAFGVLPLNHNYTWLMNDVEQLVEVPEEIDRGIRSLDEIFGICSLDDYHHGTPERADMEKVLRMCDFCDQLFEAQPYLLTVRTAAAALPDPDDEADG